MAIAIVLQLRWNFDRLQCMCFLIWGWTVEKWKSDYVLCVECIECLQSCLKSLFRGTNFFFYMLEITEKLEKPKKLSNTQKFKASPINEWEITHLSQLSRSEAFLGKREPTLSCAFLKNHFLSFYLMSLSMFVYNVYYLVDFVVKAIDTAPIFLQVSPNLYNLQLFFSF